MPSLRNDRFPLASHYDRDWIFEHQMGPNSLWLMEWLCRDMALRPGMRVLDMGCGMAMSSVFLAREYGVQVWANDLWISAADNWQRIEAQGLGDRVFPIHAEASALPYAHDFFDAIVSVDAYHYFGLADGYLDGFSRFVRPGGRIGVAVPGRMAEIPDEPIPAHLQDWLADQPGAFETWQSAEFWRQRFSATPGIDVLLADSLPDGWRDWVSFSEMTLAAGEVRPVGFVDLARREIAAIREDAGRTLGFVRVVAARREADV
jgi:SAM-dependent methyltransferase